MWVFLAAVPSRNFVWNCSVGGCGLWSGNTLQPMLVNSWVCGEWSEWCADSNRVIAISSHQRLFRCLSMRKREVRLVWMGWNGFGSLITRCWSWNMSSFSKSFGAELSLTFNYSLRSSNHGNSRYFGILPWQRCTPGAWRRKIAAGPGRTLHQESMIPGFPKQSNIV